MVVKLQRECVLGEVLFCPLQFWGGVFVDVPAAAVYNAFFPPLKHLSGKLRFLLSVGGRNLHLGGKKKHAQAQLPLRFSRRILERWDIEKDGEPQFVFHQSSR